MVKILKEIVNPAAIIRCDSIKQKIIVFLQLLLLAKATDLIFSIGKGLLRDFNLPYKIETIYQPNLVNAGYLTFVLGFFYVSVYEELAFRLHLRPSLKNLSLSLSLIFLLFAKAVLRKFIQIDSHFFYISLFRDLIIVTVLYFVSLRLVSNTNYHTYYKSNLRVIYFLSALLWTSFHYNNYTIEFSILQFPVLTLIFFNLLVYGLLFSYARLKAGISLAILFHIVTNIIIIFL